MYLFDLDHALILDQVQNTFPEDQTKRPLSPEEHIAILDRLILHMDATFDSIQKVLLDITEMGQAEFDMTKASRREPITLEALTALQADIKALVPIINNQQTEASKYKKREKKDKEKEKEKATKP